MGIEVIFLLLVAFLVLGPKRLPNIARQAGGIMAEFNRKKREFQNQIEEEIQRLELKPSQTAVENGQPQRPMRSAEPE